MKPKHPKRYVSDLSSNEKVLIAIVRAAENFKRTHTAIFRKYGLSFPQYNVLRVLDASRNGRNKISGVSRIMLVPGANMTGIAKRLKDDNRNHENQCIPESRPGTGHDPSLFN